jgi:hypothetical protein
MSLLSLQFVGTTRAQDAPERNVSNMVSTHVLIDSWVYGAFEALASKGYPQSAFDGFSDDQPFPLLYPTESVWISGVVFRRVPRAHRLSIRMEGLLSPHRDLAFPGFFYFNVHYLSGYTNSRQLIGSWIGCEGDREQLWATWQISPRSNVEVSGRSMTVNREFLQGGDLRDVKVATDLFPLPEWQLHVEEQTEWWRFPLLSEHPQQNPECTFQLSYRPTWRRDDK